MKIRAPELLDRALQVGAEIRNAERIGAPKAHDAATLATVDKAVAGATQAMAQEIVAGRGKYRERDFSFSVLAHMRDQAAKMPAEEGERIWKFGGDAALQDKVEAQLTAALAGHGLAADAVRFSTANYDGILEVRVRGVHEGPPAPTPEALARVTGAASNSATTPLDARTSGAIFATTTRLLDEATSAVTGYERAGYDGRTDAKVIGKLTVALEKAGKQLGAVNAAGGGPATEAAQQLQQAYVRLLYTLSGATDLFAHAQQADDRGAGAPAATDEKADKGLIRWMMDALSAGKSKVVGESGSFEKRIRAALVGLYDHAPLGATPATPPATRNEQVQAGFSLATPAMVSDPRTVALFDALAAQRETAANAELVGDYPRAKSAYRNVASELAGALGPALVTGQALAELGDFSLRAGKDDRASRAYVGALRIMLQHLPADHALVRETAQKLETTGSRWLASLDGDQAKPMASTARIENAQADRIRAELGLDAILAQQGPATTTLPGASAAEWGSALDRARANHTPRTESGPGWSDPSYGAIHQAIHGPSRGW